MFFRRKSTGKETETGQAGTLTDWTLLEDRKIQHREYTIMPCVKQLTNGKWVVRLAFETNREEGPQRYDFPGPMREYENQQAACEAGLKFAIKRIETLDKIAAQKVDLE